ncbi:hypothetical protein COI98_29030 [Bacillus cereus]|uniref:Uncharacterized protein n=2 Tax=Bacillus cereus TaxID=1396 RepID=A0A9X6WVX7_BACCE|nr:hypothetical protein COI98_29030 [Bacillus cereus]
MRMIKFRTELANMSQEALLNFIWLYNEYIKEVEEINLKEGKDYYPVQIDEFHRTAYQQMKN